MKYCIILLLFALVAVAVAKVVQEQGSPEEPQADDARGKRGLVLGTYGIPYSYGYHPYPYAYTYPAFRYYYGSPYYLSG